jgi:hypothetical protein
LPPSEAEPTKAPPKYLLDEKFEASVCKASPRNARSGCPAGRITGAGLTIDCLGTLFGVSLDAIIFIIPFQWL